MKRIISLGFILAIAVGISYGQRHIKGQLGITPWVGIVDQFPAKSLRNGGNGYSLGLDLVRYTKTESYWKVSMLYDRKFYDFMGLSLCSERYLMGFDYSVITLKDPRRRFYIAPMVGGFVGVETINRNEYELPQGRILTKSQIVPGLNIGVEGELYISEKTALVLGFSEKWLITSQLSNFHTYGQLGVRYSFFK